MGSWRRAAPPFAVVQRAAFHGRPPVDTPQAYHRTSRAAMEHAERVTLEWARLVSGQPPVLAWFVIDTRDGSEQHPTAWSRRFTHDPEQAAQTNTLF